MCQNLPRTTEKEPCVLTFRFSFGDIAQLVEQMTFNHWVQGSSPCVPTRNKTTLSGVFLLPARAGIFYREKNSPPLKILQELISSPEYGENTCDECSEQDRCDS